MKKKSSSFIQIRRNYYAGLVKAANEALSQLELQPRTTKKELDAAYDVIGHIGSAVEDYMNAEVSKRIIRFERLCENEYGYIIKRKLT